MTAFGTRLLTFKMGGTEVTTQVSNVTVESAPTDSDFVSFADAAAGGGRKYTLKGTATQDPANGTIFDKIWSATGTTVAVVIAPNGGAAPSEATPAYNCNAIISEPDGEAPGDAEPEDSAED